MRVLFVCMGNICRSPTAEAVLRQRVVEAGLDAVVEIDSAGTHAHHFGHSPDGRATAHAARRGYDLAALRARRVTAEDFERFDLVLAMDDDNVGHLKLVGTEAHHIKLRRLMEFAPSGAPRTVPDPYYGGAAGFERVLDLIELACEGLVVYLRSQQGSIPDNPSGIGLGKPE